MDRCTTVILGALWALCASGALAGCDDGGDKRAQLIAGCSSDKDCPEGTVCEKRNCRTANPAAAKAKAKASAPKAGAPPRADADDLMVRLCPGYWGKSQNTGTMIAKNLATGKKKYLRLNVVVPDDEFQDEFLFKALPHGRYEIQTFSGVIAEGKQDLLTVPCADRQACTADGARRLVDHGPPPPKEERDKQLLKWQREEWPGTQKCPKNHECDEGALLRRPCDFDVDRDLPNK